MRWVIVNGDDFGVSSGVSVGIAEAHRHGIVTSTSLMVDMPWSVQASHLSLLLPELSVGLHVHLVRPPESVAACTEELQRQVLRFQSLMGRLPTHLDSHRNVHRDARWLPCFLEVAAQYGLPLRGCSRARLLDGFYGQWHGQFHPEHVSVERLTRLLETEVQDGVTEVCCHPGYVDAGLSSSYTQEREHELRTLCSPEIRRVLEQQRIHLISFGDLERILVEPRKDPACVEGECN